MLCVISVSVLLPSINLALPARCLIKNSRMLTLGSWRKRKQIGERSMFGKWVLTHAKCKPSLYSLPTSRLGPGDANKLENSSKNKILTWVSSSGSLNHCTELEAPIFPSAICSTCAFLLSPKAYCVCLNKTKVKQIGGLDSAAIPATERSYHLNVHKLTTKSDSSLGFYGHQCYHQRSTLLATQSTLSSQLRFYRGRSRQQENSSVDIVPQKLPQSQIQPGAFQKDVENFQTELQTSRNDFEHGLIPQSVDNMSVPELSRHALNLVPYVKRSRTLQSLVKLGVNLDRVQNVEGVAELLLRSQFERDVAPLIHLLHMMGVPAGEMGRLLTRNPLLFTQSLEDLSARFGYLLHKRFTQEEAASIVVRSPVTLLMDPVKMVSKLGFMQQTFGLTGKQVRLVILKYPKLLPWRRDMIANVRFHLKEFMAFKDSQLKEILLKEPKIYLSSPSHLTTNFDYITNEMGVSRAQLMQFPGAVRTRLHILEGRHRFLQSRGLAQYEPRLPNFVSLSVLCTGSDAQFCQKVGKCTEEEFHTFLKTL